MPALTDPLPALKAALASHLPAQRLATPRLVPLGSEDLDHALQGGLARGALHECFAAMGASDAAATSGFGLALAMRLAVQRPLVWIRQDVLDGEAGHLYGAGLAEFGLDPARLILVRVHDQAGGLRAANEALRCPALGAVLIELWGVSKALDLTAGRRLALSAERSGVTPILIRLGAAPTPSAAMSRWSVTAAASAPLEANAPGRPAFRLSLLRHRAGIPGQTWHVEWDRDRYAFSDPAPLSRPMVPVPICREVGAPNWRHAS